MSWKKMTLKQLPFVDCLLCTRLDVGAVETSSHLVLATGTRAASPVCGAGWSWLLASMLTTVLPLFH